MKLEGTFDSLYTGELRAYVDSMLWPKNVQFDIIEYPDYLAIRLYRSNFDRQDGEWRHYVAMLVKELIEKVRSTGVPMYLEVLGRRGDDA